MMLPRAATTGVPRRDERPRDATTAADERPGQGRRDPRPAPPDHGARTPTRQAEVAVRPDRPGVAGSAAPPAADAGATRPASAGAPRHHPAVAPRPDRPPPREGLPSQAAWPAPNAALDPGPSAAPGTGKQQLGLPTRARRTPRAGREGRCVYGLGDPPRGRNRPGARAVLHHLGQLLAFLRR